MSEVIIHNLSIAEFRDAVRAELEAFFVNHAKQTANEPEELGDIQMAMDVTGLAKATLYSLASKRIVPHSKRGKRLYFYRSELVAWIEAGRRRTQAEITGAR